MGNMERLTGDIRVHSKCEVTQTSGDRTKRWEGQLLRKDHYFSCGNMIFFYFAPYTTLCYILDH